MRIEGWEQRLGLLVEQARNQPYVLGHNDCVRMACSTILAVTGQDHWPRIVGKYHDFDSACELIAQWGDTFEDAFTRFFDLPTCDWRMAQRGYVGVMKDDTGMKHLGVHLGQNAVVLGPDGLLFLRPSQLHLYWVVN